MRRVQGFAHHRGRAGGKAVGVVAAGTGVVTGGGGRAVSL